MLNHASTLSVCRELRHHQVPRRDEPGQRWFGALRVARNSLDGWLRRPTSQALARRGCDSVITGEFYTDLPSVSGIPHDGLGDHQIDVAVRLYPCDTKSTQNISGKGSHVETNNIKKSSVKVLCCYNVCGTRDEGTWVVSTTTTTTTTTARACCERIKAEAKDTRRQQMSQYRPTPSLMAFQAIRMDPATLAEVQSARLPASS